MELPATLWAVAPNFHSLAEMATRVNETLCRDGLPNRLVSLVYLELESNSDRVRLLNAGQLPTASPQCQRNGNYAPGFARAGALAKFTVP